MAERAWSADDVRGATDRFAAGLADAVPDAPVPACPGWTVVDLVAHLGNVHVWASRIVETGEAAESPDDVPEAGDLEGWYSARAGRLVDALESADPDAPCWNFSGVNPVKAFWPRRQTHETLMHVVDLDQAHGRATELDATLCADGVAEVIEVFGPRMFARGFRVDLDAPVALHATDTGDTWTLAPGDDGPPRVVEAAPAPADRLEGTAEQLWLLLWKRGDEGVSRTGDADLLARYLASRLTP